METQTQGAAGYYVWEAPGKAFAIHIHLDVVDALLAEVMRGFGAVPKRGAEVGGLLLGSIEKGTGLIVRIEDFEPVACGYTRGPSYLFSPEERQTFEDACASWSMEAARGRSPERSYAVGFFRSHTRDGLSLAAEDIELMDRCFPDASAVALLVKPFATKAGPAGFFFRQNGAFPETTPLEFPFRRRELTGEEPPERRPLTERKPSDRKPGGASAVVKAEPVGNPDPGSGELAEPEPEAFEFESYGNSAGAGLAYAITTPARSRAGSWMWIPMSFIFLLLGVALGYLAALNVTPKSTLAATADYSLSMAVLKTGETLTLQWNGEAPVIRKAEKGVLEIHDGAYAKSVDLDGTALRNGKVTFQNSSNAVSFRLTVFLNPNLSVSENVGWHQ